MTSTSNGGDGGLSRGAWAGRVLGAAVSGAVVAAQVCGAGSAAVQYGRPGGLLVSTQTY